MGHRAYSGPRSAGPVAWMKANIAGGNERPCLPRKLSTALISKVGLLSRLSVTISGHVPAVRFLLITRMTTWLRSHRFLHAAPLRYSG